MPVNKSARLRFDVLDECLRNSKKKWTKTDLLRHVNRRLELRYGADTSISVSQIRYDLESLETEFGAPIQRYKDGKNYYYRYEDPTFSLYKIPVQEEDLQKLGNAVSLLKQINGFTIAEEIEEIVSRLKCSCKDSCKTHATELQNSAITEDAENLEDISIAILNKTPLKLIYQAFKDEKPRTFNLHPYQLKEFAHRWYLLGLCEEKQNLIILGLDCIHEIKVSRLPFVPNAFIDSINYFRDLVGVTLHSNQSVETIELLFSIGIAPFVQTHPLHCSQEILQNYEDGSLRLSLNAYINHELISLLLSYGHNVRVLQPAKLKMILLDTAKAVVEQYECTYHSE